MCRIRRTRLNCVFKSCTYRPCLVGLHERLHEQLRPEPCQTGVFAAAPVVKPTLELVAASTWEAEPRFRGSKRLRPLLPGLPLLALDGAPHHREEARFMQLSEEKAAGGEGSSRRRGPPRQPAAEGEGRGGRGP